jgi:amino-acid N-acetyltransferase
MSSFTKPDSLETISAEEDVPMIVRKAVMTDVKLLLRLINAYASLGIMLPRTEAELAESIRDFMVAETGTELAGCGALHFYGTTTAEVRSLAVDPRWKRHRIGTHLMGALEAEARANGLHSIFAFTYVPGFFDKFDFVEVQRESLPSKVWKDCLRCPKFLSCDETAMQKNLLAQMGAGSAAPISGGYEAPETREDVVIQLPVLKKES